VAERLTPVARRAERAGIGGRDPTGRISVATQENAVLLFNSGDVDAFVDTLFAVDAIDHDPAPGQGPGREGYRTFFRSLTIAFPDAHLEPAVHVVADDKIAFAYTLTGTHKGQFDGIAPTGKRVEVRGLQIGRFESGQIVERWGSSDQLGILTQIGAAPSGEESVVYTMKNLFSG
jgi:predicted ester cyclase